MKLSELKRQFPNPQSIKASHIHFGSYYSPIKPTYIDEAGVEKSTLVYLQDLSGNNCLIKEVINLVTNNKTWEKSGKLEFLCESRLPKEYESHVIYERGNTKLKLDEESITLGDVLLLPKQDRQNFVDTPSSNNTKFEGKALLQLRHFWWTEEELQKYESIFDYPDMHDEFRKAFQNAKDVFTLVKKDKDGRTKLEKALVDKDVERVKRILTHINELSPSGSLFKHCINTFFLRLVVRLNDASIFKWSIEELKRVDPSLALLKNQLQHSTQWYDLELIFVFDAIDAQTKYEIVEHLLKTMQSMSQYSDNQYSKEQDNSLFKSELGRFFYQDPDRVVRAFFTDIKRAELIRTFTTIADLHFFKLRDTILKDSLEKMKTAFQCVEVYLRRTPNRLQTVLDMYTSLSLTSSNADKANKARFFLEKVVEFDSSLIFLRGVLGDTFFGWKFGSSEECSEVLGEFREKLTEEVMNSEVHIDYTKNNLSREIYEEESRVQRQSYGFEESQRRLVALKAQLKQLQDSQATSTTSLSAGQPATEQYAKVVVAPVVLYTSLAQPNVEEGRSY